MVKLELKVPWELRRGGLAGDEKASVESALQVIQLTTRNFTIPDLGDSSVLDMGCGCKLVQAILNHNLPIGRYVGIDVFPELIKFLQSEVTDPRFDFHIQNTHNEMYNPQGEPLGPTTRLPVEEESFDIICLFSVFTHLAPHDYVSILQMLRRYIKPSGRIIFSLYVNETTSGGKGLIDRYSRPISKNGGEPEQVREKFEKAMKNHTIPDFLDVYPDRPLQVALYSREYALRLVQDTGWEVESLNDPEEAIQHYMICRPV